MSQSVKRGLYGGAALFLAAALLMTFNTYRLVTQGDSLTGTVVAIDTLRATSSGTGRPGWVQRPRISTTLPNGTTTEFHPKVGSYRSAFQVGQQLELLYLADGPEPLALKSFATTWLLPLILFGMASLLIGVCRLLTRIMPSQSGSG